MHMATTNFLKTHLSPQYQHLNAIQTQINYLQLLDIEGAYIAGSAAAYFITSHFSSPYCRPGWSPNDIDIFCITPNAWHVVREKLGKISVCTQEETHYSMGAYELSPSSGSLRIQVIDARKYNDIDSLLDTFPATVAQFALHLSNSEATYCENGLQHVEGCLLHCADHTLYDSLQRPKTVLRWLKKYEAKGFFITEQAQEYINALEVAMSFANEK